MTFSKNATSIIVKGAQLPFPRNETPSQNRIIAESGKAYVYTRGWFDLTLQVQIKDSAANIESLRAFLKSYYNTTFTYTPDAGVNAGNGNGVAVTVRLWGDASLPVNYTSPNYSEMNLTLRKEI